MRGDAEAKAFFGSVQAGAPPNCAEIWLHSNHFGARGTAAIARALEAGAFPKLVYLVFESQKQSIARYLIHNWH